MVTDQNGRLSGKTAVVTGGATGIGRAICQRFAAEGARVVCADSNEMEVRETARLIEEKGGQAMHVVCDVSREADVEAVIERTGKEFESLHILVNNAAVFQPYGNVAEIEKEGWDRAIAVNLTGTFLMSKHAVPLIAASGGGSIIHMSSVVGHVGKAGRVAYCATKSALIGLARAMAVDHAGQGIRVNSLSPGPIATERLSQNLAGDEADAIRGRIGLTLLKRLGRPDEVVGGALFLASEESSFVTGTDLLIDGGLSAH